MYSDIYLHLPSSFFSCLKMLTLSFKFTIATQSCKMHFIFLQLGLVHESRFLLLQENCQLQEARVIRCSMVKKHKAKQTKSKQSSSNKHDHFCGLYLVHSGYPPVRKLHPFPWGRPGSPMTGLCAVVLLCGCSFAYLNCLPPFALTVPEVSTCTLVRGSGALCSCENHKDSLGMTHQCSGGPLRPKSSPVRLRVGHGLPYKSCRPLLFPGS